MPERTERIINCIIGGLFGYIIGCIALTINVPYMLNNNMSALAIASLVGVLISLFLLAHKKEKYLKRNNKLREEAIALITHEMRTGLTSTGWAIQMVLKNYGEKMTEEHKKMLEGIVGSIHTTITHSINLLDISLLDIGKISISLEQMSLDNVAQMINELVQKYKIGAGKNNIKLDSSINLDLSKQVEIDLLRIRIILENLLENAIQYTLLDKKEINVKIYNTSKTLNIEIKDTGIGIPKNQRDKIFGEFFRAQNAKQYLSSGSGIGLYLCNQYVKAHKGHIRFESEENKGTTFFITIPLKTSLDVKDFASKI